MRIEHEDHKKKTEPKEAEFEELNRLIKDTADSMNARSPYEKQMRNSIIILQILKGIIEQFGGRVMLTEAVVEKALKKKIKLNQDGGFIEAELI